MRSEQDELDQMVADRKARRHSQADATPRVAEPASPANRSSVGRGPSNGQRSGKSPTRMASGPATARRSPRTKGASTPGTQGGGDWRGGRSPDPAWRPGSKGQTAGRAVSTKGGEPGNPERLPVIPPLRLPVKRDTALRTPRVIWTAKSSREGGSTERSLAPTARGDSSARRAHTARELSGAAPSALHSHRLSSASTSSSQSVAGGAGAGAGAGAGGATGGGGGEGSGRHRMPEPPKHPRGATSDRPRSRRPGAQPGRGERKLEED
eukprot:1645457-Rhodomonas_salina.1